MRTRLTCREALGGCNRAAQGDEKDAVIQQVFEHAAAEHPQMMRKMTEDDQTVTRQTMRTLLEEKQEEAQTR